jgi:formylglycine-generating enzyme
MKTPKSHHPEVSLRAATSIHKNGGQASRLPSFHSRPQPSGLEPTPRKAGRPTFSNLNLKRIDSSISIPNHISSGGLCLSEPVRWVCKGRSGRDKTRARVQPLHRQDECLAWDGNQREAEKLNPSGLFQLQGPQAGRPCYIRAVSKRAIYGILSLLMALLACGPLLAEVPSQIHYQGLLADDKGNPVNGNRTIEVRLFDALTGGKELYHETIGPVKVVNGIYSFAFGGNGTGIAAALTGAKEYLSVSVNGTEQTPRSKILAVPYALVAKQSADAQLLDTLVGGLQTQASGLSSNLTAVQAQTAVLGANLTTLRLQFDDLSGILNPPILDKIAILIENFRVISLSGNLVFGNTVNTNQLEIANTGTGNLTVSGISYPTGFSGNWSGLIPPGASQNVTVTFSPTAVQDYEGDLTVYSNAINGPVTKRVYGKGAPASNMITVQGGTLPEGGTLPQEKKEFAGQEVATFQIGKFEVTWAEWQEVRTWAVANGYTDLAPGAGSAENHPVRQVGWHDAVKWTNAKSEKDGLTPVYQVGEVVYKTGESWPTMISAANGFRLPIDKEWVWAALGGVSSRGYTYSGSDNANEVAWNINNSRRSSATGDFGTWPVGSKAPNELGIHDMSGNVWEWVYVPGRTFNNQERGGGWASGDSGVGVYMKGAGSAPSDVNGFRLALNSGN